MLLWLLLVSGLVEGCLCSGIYSPEAPAPVVSTSEAHGPLARLALHSAGGGFPYYRHQRIPYDPAVFRLAVPPSPVVYPVAHAVNVDHRLSTISACDIQPAVTGPKHTTANFQVKKPAIQKTFYEIEERTVVRPIGTAIVEIDGPIPKNLVPSLAVRPGGHQAVSQYQPAYSYPFSTYPFVYYHPFQVPVQAYPPPFVQQPQGALHIPQQTPVYPQQPIVAPRPPQQSSTYPQQPVYGPRPPQQPPTYPQPPQKPAAKPPLPNPEPQPPSSSTGNEEFDYSDTVVIDNPDFERFANHEGQLKTPTETLSRSFQSGEKPCNEEKEARRILEEFQNRQILRQFGIKQSQFMQGVEPSQIQTLQELEELGRKLKTEDSSDEKSPTREKSSTNEKSPTANQDVPSSLRSSTNDQGLINQKLRTTPSESRVASDHRIPGEGRTNQQRLLELLSAYEKASDTEGVVRGRLVSVTPQPDGEGLTEKVSSRGVVVNRPVPEPQMTRLVRPTLAAAVIYQR